MGYFQKNSLFEILPGPKRIVFLGDSITAGCEWAELFPGIDIANRGIHVDTTSGALHRLKQIIDLKPEKVFIMLGINEILNGVSLETTGSNYKRIIEELKANGIKVFVQSTLFLGKSLSQKNSLVGELNKVLKEFCNQSMVVFIDLNEVLAKDGFLRDEFTNEGLHLMGSGYLKWKETIAPFLR